MQFIYEGEAEVLSPHLSAAMAKHRKLLEADFALSADGSQPAEPDIGLCIGARGATAVEVQVRTLVGDQHQGKPACDEKHDVQPALRQPPHLDVSIDVCKLLEWGTLRLINDLGFIVA